MISFSVGTCSYGTLHTGAGIDWPLQFDSGEKPITPIIATGGELIFKTYLPESSDPCAIGTVRLWDPASGATVRVLSTEGTEILSVALAPDDGQLAAGAEDGVIRLWDPRSGTSQGRLHGHESAVRAVAYSPDGRRLASAELNTIGGLILMMLPNGPSVLRSTPRSLACSTIALASAVAGCFESRFSTSSTPR